MSSLHYSEHGKNLKHQIKIGEKQTRKVSPSHDKLYSSGNKNKWIKEVCPGCGKGFPLSKFIQNNVKRKYCIDCYRGKRCKSCLKVYPTHKFILGGIKFDYCPSCLEEQVCPDCGNIRPLYEFYKDGKYQRRCFSCRKKMFRDRSPQFCRSSSVSPIVRKKRRKKNKKKHNNIKKSEKTKTNKLTKEKRGLISVRTISRTSIPRERVNKKKKD